MTYFSMLVVLVVYIVSTQDQALGQDAGDSLPPECTQEYMEAGEHTMCLQDDPRVITSGVSDEDKEIIVNLHNQLRGNVDPPATDMPALIWDDKIAAVAQKWAKQCTLGHDKHKNREVPSYGMSIGQNAAAGQRDWHGAIMAWYDEVRIFKYGKDPEKYIGKDGWMKIGHFTQIVQNTTFRLGCGFAKCSSTNYKRLYVCNYGPGQLTSRIITPYTKGDRASACPDSKHNGLCDCGGKMCLNKGSLDINTCTCSCQKLYSGPNCDTFTPPPEFVSDFGCKYIGQKKSKEECKGFGKKGADTWACASTGGSHYDCASCKMFTNVKRKYCPVMCGMCDPQ